MKLDKDHATYLRHCFETARGYKMAQSERMSFDRAVMAFNQGEEAPPPPPLPEDPNRGWGQAKTINTSWDR